MLEAQNAKSAILIRLHEALHEAKLRRGNYSIRQFARKIGVPAPILVQVLNGKRNLTRRLALQLLSGLHLEVREIERLVGALPEKQTRERGKKSKTAKEPTSYSELAASELSVLSEWWNFAILSLAETETFRSDPQWIAQTLGIPAIAAKRSLAHLVRLGLITEASNTARGLVLSGRRLTSTVDVPNVYIRKNHVQGLELAAERIHEIDVAERDYSSVTLTIDRSKLTEAKKRIETFRRDLASFLEGGRKESVYRLQVQLFPLSKKPKSKKTTQKKGANA